MRNKKKFADDGRVIADMSFEGTSLERKDPASKPVLPEGTEELDRKQTMTAIGGALLAGLLIGFVFISVFLLFLLFATKVWLR